MNPEGDPKAALWGTYSYTLARAGRLTVPPPWVARLGNPVVLTRAPGASLLLLSEGEWDRLSAAPPDWARRQFYFSGQARVPLCLSRSSAGRFPSWRLCVPSLLREWAALRPGAEVVLVGLGPCARLLSHARYLEWMQRLEQQDLTLWDNPMFRRAGERQRRAS